MVEMIQANWLVFIIALLIGILVAWWIFKRGSTIATPRERRPDVLDEGAERARRNQALIDSPPAAGLTPPPAAEGMAGIGEAISVAAQDEVEEQVMRKAEEADRAGSADMPTAQGDQADDLRKIKGLGPKLVTLLNSLGITRIDQIASWSEEDIDRIDPQLGAFSGRIRRDNWVEQAKLLSGGDTAAYEAKFGKL